MSNVQRVVCYDPTWCASPMLREDLPLRRPSSFSWWPNQGDGWCGMFFEQHKSFWWVIVGILNTLSRDHGIMMIHLGNPCEPNRGRGWGRGFSNRCCVFFLVLGFSNLGQSGPSSNSSLSCRTLYIILKDGNTHHPDTGILRFCLKAGGGTR